MPLVVSEAVQYFTRNPKKHWGGAGTGPYAAVVTRVHNNGSVDLYVLPNCPTMMPRIEADVFGRSPVPGDKAEHWFVQV